MVIIEKSHKEIEHLKRNWKDDPCWDLAETEGFEAHREELEQYQKEMEIKWQLETEEELDRKAAQLGIPGNHILTIYILELEDKVKRLQDQVEKILYS